MKRFCECRQAMVHSIGSCIGCDDQRQQLKPVPFMDTPGDITCPADVAVALTKPIAEIVAQAIVADRKRRAA